MHLAVSLTQHAGVVFMIHWIIDSVTFPSSLSPPPTLSIFSPLLPLQLTLALNTLSSGLMLVSGVGKTLNEATFIQQQVVEANSRLQVRFP